MVMEKGSLYCLVWLFREVRRRFRDFTPLSSFFWTSSIKINVGKLLFKCLFYVINHIINNTQSMASDRLFLISPPSCMFQTFPISMPQSSQCNAPPLFFCCCAASSCRRTPKRHLSFSTSYIPSRSQALPYSCEVL